MYNGDKALDGLSTQDLGIWHLPRRHASGDTSAVVFLENTNGNEHPGCGRHHSLDWGTELNKKGECKGGSCILCFPTVGVSAALPSRHDGRYLQTGSQLKSFLPGVAFVKYSVTAVET